jgi:hypothetical protein
MRIFECIRQQIMNSFGAADTTSLSLILYVQLLTTSLEDRVLW